MKKFTSVFFLIFLLYNTGLCQNDTSCFNKYIRVELSADIKNIHCFEDSYYKVQIAFECNKTTLDSIVAKLHLVRDDSYAYMEHIYQEFDWWQHSKLRKLKCVYKTKIHTDRIQSGPWIFVGYNEKTSQLYYGRFDL